ncbi:hypothetical protein AB0D71_39585 [Streptomyces avermitilis]|uniref:hypothetical protein n=1 Tax=Streptomyces avermitilis TaxID=33903 RepID=UPI0033D0D952
MATPDELERQYTLLSAAARFDALRTRDALAPPPDDVDGLDAGDNGSDGNDGNDGNDGDNGNGAESDAATDTTAPLTRKEALELLALGEVLARKAAYGRQLSVRSARRAGASWSQIGAALGTSKQAAWEAHNRWIDEQAKQDRKAGHWGLNDKEIDAARTLAGELDN